MFGVALPAALGFEVGDLIGTAMGAPNDAIRPADFHDGLVAVVVVGEEQNRLLESFGFSVASHECIMAEN